MKQTNLGRRGASQHTFGESLGVAVDLQGIQRADLKVNVVVQELLHYWFERQHQLLLLIQLLLTRGSKLLFVIIRVDFIGDVLQEAVRT